MRKERFYLAVLLLVGCVLLMSGCTKSASRAAVTEIVLGAFPNFTAALFAEGKVAHTILYSPQLNKMYDGTHNYNGKNKESIAGLVGERGSSKQKHSMWWWDICRLCLKKGCMEPGEFMLVCRYMHDFGMGNGGKTMECFKIRFSLHFYRTDKLAAQPARKPFFYPCI